MNEKLLATVRYYFAQSVFCNRCHYYAMYRLKNKENGISIFIGIVTSITIISLILQVIGLENKLQTIINIAASLGLLATTISLIFQIINKNDRPQEIFEHRMFAEKYKFLRDDYISLVEEIMSDCFPEDQIRIKSESLLRRYSNIGEHAPVTNSSDYKKAQKGLGISKDSKEEFTWSDSEIDKFLPEKLRIMALVR